jgi:glycosyltransferase involved in cell wall biosynthesis
MCEISVIVPFYNVQEYLDQCIEGLLAQNYPKDKYEIILVDNNSTDDSAEIAKRYHGVKLLLETKQGSYAARNCGIRVAKGKILAFTDSDCIPTPNWLSSIVKAMKNPHVGLLLGNRRYASNSPALAMMEKYEFERIAYITSQEVKEFYYGYTNNMAVRRSLFEQLGLFQERFRGADTTFVRQVVDKLGCSAVQSDPNIEVLHLEINGIVHHYQKCLTYGRSYEFTNQLNKRRPLPKLASWQIYRQTCQKYKMSFQEQLILLFTIVVSVLSYSFGQYRSKAILQINKLFPQFSLKRDVV